MVIELFFLMSDFYASLFKEKEDKPFIKDNHVNETDDDDNDDVLVKEAKKFFCEKCKIKVNNDKESLKKHFGSMRIMLIPFNSFLIITPQKASRI